MGIMLDIILGIPPVYEARPIRTHGSKRHHGLCMHFYTYGQSYGSEPRRSCPTIIRVNCVGLKPPPDKICKGRTGLDYKVADSLFSDPDNDRCYHNALHKVRHYLDEHVQNALDQLRPYLARHDRKVLDKVRHSSDWYDQEALDQVRYYLDRHDQKVLDHVQRYLDEYDDQIGCIAIMVSCHIGVHRSVAMAERLATETERRWTRLSVHCRHLDLGKGIARQRQAEYRERCWPKVARCLFDG